LPAERTHLGLDIVEPAEELAGASGEELALRGERDAAAGATGQRGPDLLLKPGEMVTDRRLGVVQLLRRRGDRPRPRDRVDHAKPMNLHPSMIPMISAKTLY
jgi:hypothetical protein